MICGMLEEMPTAIALSLYSTDLQQDWWCISFNLSAILDLVEFLLFPFPFAPLAVVAVYVQKRFKS